MWLGEMEMNNRKPNGYWKSKENTLAEAHRIMEAQGVDSLPPERVLEELGYHSLRYAISTYHGGFHAFRELLGEEQIHVKKGSWESLDFTVTEARKIMVKEKWKTIPADNILTEHGYSSLGASIQKYHGGFHKFRKALGEEQKQLPHGTWKKLSYVLNSAKRIMKKEGWTELPSADVVEQKYRPLFYAIHTHHGGFHKFRKALGEEQKQLPHGTWKNLEFTVGAARTAMQENEWEELPATRTLKKRGYHGLASAIDKYHGGMSQFRRVFSERTDSRTESQRLTSLLEQYVHGGNE